MENKHSNDEESWRSFLYSPYVSSELSYLEPILLKRPPLSKNERLAFPHPDSLKRSALLFDRIYTPCYADLDLVENLPVELTFGNPDLDLETLKKTATYAEVFWPWKLTDANEKLGYLLEYFLKDPLTRYRTTFQEASFVPVNYDAGTVVIPSGKHIAYQGVLDNVPIVVEKQLSWEQVKAFREDNDARRKYRDLHLWITSLSAESEQHASDLIGQKLDDYRYAIKKHGLSTTIEAMSSFLSLSTVVPPMAGLAAKAMQFDPLMGAAVGGIVAVAGASAWIAKRMLDLEGIKRGQNREVAYLYEITKLAGGRH